MATSAKVAVLGASGIGKFHARDLQANGCEVVAILGSSPQTAEATAEKLKELVGQIKAKTKSQKIDIIAHSMGGLISRYYIKNLGGSQRID
ncbi:MAG: alpha/beta hydrolase, partial [Candidatus Woesearchaeota archaeon]|nr:alpha/beta hydrolase [Candidatus Woesearchaeota archaeon]